MVGDVDVAEVAGLQRVHEDPRGDGGRGESADERATARLVQPATPLPGGDATTNGREERKPEGDEESGAPEVGHAASLAVDRARLLR